MKKTILILIIIFTFALASVSYSTITFGVNAQSYGYGGNYAVLPEVTLGISGYNFKPINYYNYLNLGFGINAGSVKLGQMWRINNISYLGLYESYNPGWILNGESAGIQLDTYLTPNVMFSMYGGAFYGNSPILDGIINGIFDSLTNTNNRTSFRATIPAFGASLNMAF